MAREEEEEKLQPDDYSLIHISLSELDDKREGYNDALGLFEHLIQSKGCFSGKPSFRGQPEGGEETGSHGDRSYLHGQELRGPRITHFQHPKFGAPSGGVSLVYGAGRPLMRGHEDIAFQELS